MKYQQGLLLESTRVSFSLSHQCSVNGAVRSWCCLSALQGVGRACRRKGALLGQHDSPGLSVAPCDQGEPEHRGQELQHICEKHCCQCSLGRTKIFMHHHSGPVCPTQDARGSPGGLQGQQTLTVLLMQLWEICVGAGFCQRDVFIHWQCSWLELQSQLGLPEGSLAWPAFSCL